MTYDQTLARILADIRSLPVVTARSCLDVVVALMGVQSDSGPTTDTLYDCRIGLEDVIADQASNEAAADFIAQRDERARLADRVPVTFSAREVPEFLSTAI